MAFFHPCLFLELAQCLQNSLRTYTMRAVRVRKVSCKINLVRLHLLEQFLDDVYVRLCALTLLDSASLIEWKVKEVAVGFVVETERANCAL